MKRTIKILTDGTHIEYDQGKFDAWCVYLIRPNGERIAPRDVEYFTRFQQLGSKYGSESIYQDFVAIYAQTDSIINEKILINITQIAAKYPTDALVIDKLLTIVYGGMVAEENKEKAILKKRIKRLGMHQVLMENLPPAVAANFSKGKKWRELDEECKLRGF
ncbi:MAG: hypothetical protein DSM107014_15125 [Gomphosphaeria aponina SAG 52.96 = DSM 107014]|uniref:Uncharacterized protein n=1 Tax=Gomphosphaeria aponina SAG 52.96 = DSM 107014 TaxID=1521640 RepID=A0A941GTG6_9CHRO|nr:hypothetical protein [Gomphosphaeria aponina SAG 52.96 = DSM 107014]